MMRRGGSSADSSGSFKNQFWDVRLGLILVALSSPNGAMIGLTAALADFFVTVVKQTKILGPQDAALREFFAENDFWHAPHHTDPRMLCLIFIRIWFGPAAIPVLAADAPSRRLGVAVLKQICERLIVVVLVDPVGVERQVGGIQNSDERDVVNLVVGAMPVLAVEHWHPVANEAFTSVPGHDRNQMTVHPQKWGGLFVQFDGKHTTCTGSPASSSRLLSGLEDQLPFLC
jgi:hypothetical protein